MIMHCTGTSHIDLFNHSFYGSTINQTTLTDYDFLDNSNKNITPLIPISIDRGISERFFPVIEEINELKELKKGWNNGKGEAISEKSVINSVNFLHILNKIVQKNIKIPSVAPTPTNEISLTWRKQNVGILNLIFSQNNKISYACYLEHPEKRCFGSLKFNFNSINKRLINLIQRFQKNEE